jgi:hypothetical protein
MGDKKSGFPIRIKSGSATVRIYDRSDAYPYYRVSHYVGSQRHMKPFTRLADARRQARQIAEQISAGEVRPGEIRKTDVRSTQVEVGKIFPRQEHGPKVGSRAKSSLVIAVAVHFVFPPNW